MEPTDPQIHTVETPGDMAAISRLFQQIWGTVTPLVSVEILCAIAKSGGYVAVARDGDNVIGASFGFLARHDGAPALHSHVTGVLPGVQHSGVGRAMKLHQRDWAAALGIDWITWTFDPLVRRNAWFNLRVLGAKVASYHVNFYGPMTDSLNAHDESDRLLLAWPTTDRVEPDAPATDVPTEPVDTPEDIVVLRRTDPEGAARWRERLRRELGGRLGDGGRVVDFTRDGHYLVTIPAAGVGA